MLPYPWPNVKNLAQLLGPAIVFEFNICCVVILSSCHHVCHSVFLSFRHLGHLAFVIMSFHRIVVSSNVSKKASNKPQFFLPD